ncbi:MAG: NAD(P)H-hydrate dehydratase [Clostridiales bacterium]|nr:NAD(P)H-hydrate dehydratase [Clostridiales bacterium]
MKLLDSAQLREMDRYAIDVLGVPSTLLMSNAAQHVADAALSLLRENGRSADGSFAAVFCGAGNNGGDGIAAASYLMKHGLNVRVFLTGSRDRLTPDSIEMERRLNELGGVVEDITRAADVECYVNHSDVIIDAVFGIGLNTELHGSALDAVRLINSSPARVVAADIPSGVEADTGRILGDAVNADVTITFSFAKPGHFVEPGCACCGDVRVVDIGIPAELIDRAETDCCAVTSGDITLPRRRKVTHKGDYGRDLIVAGSVGYSGAPVLAAKAASISGAGLVSLGVPEAIYQIAAVKCDEEMPFPLPCTAEGSLAGLAVYAVLDRLKKADACLLGPGLGQSQSINEIVAAVLKHSHVPLILDADGINAVAGNIDILDEAVCPVVLTPHAGEFKRLGAELSGGNRLSEARRFAEAHGCIVVLKGHRTITALPDGTAYINTTGGPAMAKGGTGDVLAGMITSFAGQNFPIKDAVLAAVYLHGLAGDMCAARYGEYSVTAGSILTMLPQAIMSVISNT